MKKRLLLNRLPLFLAAAGVFFAAKTGAAFQFFPLPVYDHPGDEHPGILVGMFPQHLLKPRLGNVDPVEEPDQLIEILLNQSVDVFGQLGFQYC